MQEYGVTAAGHHALDAMIKAAPITVIRVVTVNPGKLVVLCTGDLASVEASLSAGRAVAGDDRIDELLIPNVHPSVADVLTGSSPKTEWGSVGIIDVATITSGVRAADIVAKEADVTVVQIRFDDSMGGRSSIRFTGSLHDVEASMTVAEDLLTVQALLVRRVIIANPHPEFLPTLTAETDS
jgi:microcompartment protein CcmL/EutN